MFRWFRKPLYIAVAVSVAIGGLSGCVVLRPGAIANPAPSASAQRPSGLIALPQDVVDRGVLRFGSQIASPPLISYGQDGSTVEGINADVVNEIGRRLGVDVEWTQLPFAGLIPAVQSGKLDAAIDLIGDTPKRAATVDFVNYMNQATSPLVQAGNPHGINSVEDLCGLGAAVVRGGIQIELAEEASAECVSAGKPAIEISQFNNPGDARLSVQAGRVAAFLGNTPVMRFIAESPATASVFDMGGEATYQLTPIGIITAKNQRDLHDSVQSAIDMMLEDGTIDEILARWRVSDLALNTREKTS